ncbi:class I SAM-dependent methyltransferase [Acinetobacter puyangensis]|uniref:class I SAM-dependent methyltransferase n=1 Tax=Acinetobacter puyangensis TaxID=1096779 RepID=UPI003A4D8C13
MNKINLNLKNEIADTLLITLYAKYVETLKKDPLIHDQVACELVDKIDYDFSKFKNKKSSSVGVAIRASHFDQMVSKFIQKHQNNIPVIVFIGCGLDARIHRIGSIVEHAEFYQLDIDEVIQARQQLIPPKHNEHLISSSMLETAWLDELTKQHPSSKFMFVIEGVLMYFTELQNKQLLGNIADRFLGAEIHFDILNRWMSTKSALHDTVRKTKAVFKSGIDNNYEIEQWHPHLKFVQVYRFNDFKGWRRMGLILTTLMSIVPQFKTSSRILIYEVR